MKNLIELVCTILLVGTNLINSQDFNIQGLIKDSDTKLALESATVFVKSSGEGKLISYTITNKNGKFELIGETDNDVLFLYVSYVGYENFARQIKLLNRQINLGEILINSSSLELEEVIVSGEASPILVKKDTLEFNVKSFNTRSDSTLEDLLKNIPGVEVQNDGKIRVNGKEVNNILVNGKPFFSKDIKIATKSFTTDMIDKIQVVDSKTEKEEFTNSRSSSDNKTINIKIKKDHDKGVFGRLSAGYGDQKKYQISGIVNYLNGNQRISLLGGANNIDNPGFTYDDLSELSRNARDLSWRGNRQGISTSSDLGFNFTDGVGRGDLFVEYFYSDIKVDNNQIVDREYFLPNQHYFTKSKSTNYARENNHSSNSTLVYNLGKYSQIIISPSFDFTKKVEDNFTSSETINEDNQIQNSSFTSSSLSGNEKEFSNKIDYLSKFKNKGGYLNIEFSNTNIDKVYNEFLDANLKVFNVLNQGSTTNQLIENSSREDAWKGTLEYQHFLKQKLFLNLKYEVSKEVKKFNRSIYNSNDNNEDYDRFDDELSSNLTVKNYSSILSVGLEYAGDKVSADFSLGWLYLKQNNNETLSLNKIIQSFNNFYVDSYIKYKINNGNNLNFTYQTNAEFPQIEFLSPVSNVTNPLNIITGNLDLKPEVSNAFSVSYDNYNYQMKSGIFVYGSFEYMDNAIAQIKETQGDFLNSTTFTNVDGNMNSNFRVSFNKIRKNKLSSYKYSVGFNMRYLRTYNFLNDFKYRTGRLSMYPLFSFIYGYGDLLEFKTSYSPRKIITTYDNEFLNDNNIFSHSIGVNTTTYWPKNIILENDLQFNYRPDIRPGFSKSNTLWNISLGLELFKGKGIARLRIYDLLNENISAYRYTTNDYIQDSESELLQRYLLISFTYKINNISKD
ncbi:TonB-dependent receptor [Sinomicrobium pectinilyticum]|uniref:TonB-dependent receptor n=1 Tax=Sinomicrobium pectinilyticum TaxID=1084421 RepID=A0A3N0CYT7_SINP1|nr:outer membrane beta-barrel protein [Sinomicrobium pectinilyticum]RNL68587.1 TonB-dependent receptor [Sinomicrobium pectinilyticum]